MRRQCSRCHPVFPWTGVGGTETFGNNALGFNATTQDTLTGDLRAGILTFDPASGEGVEQQLLNVSYFCNLMHDFLCLLGFDEAAGKIVRFPVLDAVEK